MPLLVLILPFMGHMKVQIFVRRLLLLIGRKPSAPISSSCSGLRKRALCMQANFISIRLANHDVYLDQQMRGYFINLTQATYEILAAVI